MMTILIFLNVSNFSNIEADSGFIFIESVLRELCVLRPDWQFILAAPFISKDLPENTTHLLVRAPSSKYNARFVFDWDSIESFVRALPRGVDVLWCNQPEHTAALRSLVQTTLKKEVKALTYCHYLPFHFDDDGCILLDSSLNDLGSGSAILNRFVEGYRASDLTLVASQFALDILKKGGQVFGWSLPAESFRIVNPPAEMRMVTPVKPILQGKTRLFYNHRLYDHYGTKVMAQWLQELIRLNGARCEVLVSSPHAGRTLAQSQLDATVDENESMFSRMEGIRLVRPTTRSEYLAHLLTCHAGIGPLRPAAPWSMSVVDCMVAGVPPLVFNSGCFPEIMRSCPELLFSTRAEFLDKAQYIIENPTFRDSLASKCCQRTVDWHPRTIASEFLQIIERDLVKVR